MKRQTATGGASADLWTTRSHDAFGAVVVETDALQQKTRYGYDMAGRVVSITRPTVVVLGEDGVSRQAAPVETFQYDRSGRLVAQGDANGGLTKRTLLAGTGYGGTTALVTAAFQADGGVTRNSYDGFGDLREQVDAMSHHTRMGYDALGRLTSMARPGTSADFERPETYGYDVLGQRIRHGIGTTGLVETTEYDQQGRVVAQVDVLGDRTTTGYAWDGALSTGGMGTFGGWRTVTGYADGRSVTSSADVFGRVVSTVDAGGHRSSRQYDVAGRLASVYDTDRSQRRVDYGWLDTGLLASERLDADTGAAGVKQRAYGYDALGHRTRETLSVGGMSYQDATAVYDGLGRMTTWSEAATDAGAAASMAWGYDAVGNIRQTVAVRPQLDQTGAVVATAATETLWYAYDAMNRVTIDGGALANGHVVRGSGASMAYDQAGRRVSMAQDVALDAEVEVFVPDRANQLDGPGHYEWRTVGYAGERREFYAYAADGALSAVTTYQSGYVQDEYGSPTVHSTGTTNRWAGSSTFGYDAQGRQTRQVDTDEKHRAVYDRATAYDAAGRVTTQTVVQLQDVGLAGQYTQSSTTTNAYGQAGTAGYAQGQVLSSTTTSQRNQEAVQSSATTNAYVWYAGAQLASATTTGAGAATTRYTYDAFGALASVRIEDARARDVTLVSDTNGQAIRRDEADGLTTQGDPHERWYRFGGVEIGHVGNNGAQPADYARSVDARGRAAGSQPFAVVDPRYGAGFAAGAERITSYATGSAAGGYTVRSGDTLAGIAQSLWGDSALWYKLAEANGLTAGSALPVGRTLSVPAGVVRSRYNASTFKPYDPADTLGDTNPVSAAPTAKAAGKAKCGAFGQILLSVIAIAVTIALPGPGVIAGAINGAIGSAVSQGVGLATGLQDRFSFKGVALAAIGGGVGGALQGAAFGAASGLARVGSDVVRGVVRGAIGSAATQGIALATGLQDRFDWAGVAAAGVIGGIGGAADRGLARAGAGGFGRDLGASAASAIAGAGARSLLTGTDFGDTILAVLPDVIGTTLGRAVARGIVGGGGGGEARGRSGIVSGDLAIGPVSARDAASGGFTFRDGMAYAASGASTGGGASTLVRDAVPLYTAREPGVQYAVENAQGDLVVTAPRPIGNYDFGAFRSSWLTGYNVADRLAQAGSGPSGIAQSSFYSRATAGLSQFGRDYMTAFDQSYGPNSAYGRYVAQPFWNGVAAIADSPLGDVGIGMSIEQAGAGLHPLASIPGAAVITGQRGLRLLGRGAAILRGSIAESAGGIRTAEGVLYNGITGPGPLGVNFAGTFRSGSYTEIITSETTSLYRVYGGKAGEIGPYWTRTEPRGPLQSVIDSALDPAWGNNATRVVKINVPRGVKIYDGAAASQRGLVGGGNQVFVPRVDESWIVR